MSEDRDPSFHSIGKLFIETNLFRSPTDSSRNRFHTYNNEGRPNPSIRDMLQDTFTAWDMPNVDLDGYSLRLNAKDSRNQAAQYVVEKEDPEGVTRIYCSPEELKIAILVLDYSPSRKASDLLKALNQATSDKTDCKVKAEALLKETTNSPESMLEPLKEQGALAVALDFLGSQTENLQDQRNLGAITNILEFFWLVFSATDDPRDPLQLLTPDQILGDHGLLRQCQYLSIDGCSLQASAARDIVPPAIRIITAICECQIKDGNEVDLNEFLSPRKALNLIDYYRTPINHLVYNAALFGFNKMHYLAQFTSQGPALRQEMLRDYRELNISSKISSWYNPDDLREQVVNLQKILISDLLESCSSFSEGDTYGKLQTIRFKAFSEQHPDNAWKVLGFTDTIDSSRDISSSRYGNLALDLMFRYCQDEDSIEDFGHFVSKGGIQVPGSGCPFAASSIKLVELICQVLEERHDKDYIPIIFSHEGTVDHTDERPYFFELYKILMRQILQTWQEMEAQLEDLPKVINVTKAQLEQALSQPDLSKLESKIPKYEKVLREWKEEVQEKNNYENIKKLPIIQELIADLAPDIFSLIREQRLKVLTIGEKFQYPPAGNTRGSAKEIFVQLSPNHKNLHWGDYDNKVEEWRKSEDQSSVPIIHHLKHKIPVADIDSRHLIEGKVLTIHFSSGQNTKLELTHPDKRSLDYWNDGIGCLIDASSKTSQVYPDMLKGKGDSFRDEFEKWMEMKVKLKLMPLNGIDIPKDKPPVPPLPKNLHQLEALFQSC